MSKGKNFVSFLVLSWLLQRHFVLDGVEPGPRIAGLQVAQAAAQRLGVESHRPPAAPSEQS